MDVLCSAEWTASVKADGYEMNTVHRGLQCVGRYMEKEIIEGGHCKSPEVKEMMRIDDG